MAFDWHEYLSLARELGRSGKMMRAKRAIPWAVALALSLAGLAEVRAEWCRGQRSAEQYRALRPGMRLKEVEALFGRPADHVCQFAGGQVLYYAGSGWFHRRPDPDAVPRAAASKENIPSIYGAVELLFSRSGIMVAYTWVGEELHVHTITGAQPGSGLANLGQKELEALVRFHGR